MDPHSIQDILAAVGASATVAPQPRCECHAPVKARGDFCADCERAMAAQLRTMFLERAVATIPRGWEWARFGVPEFNQRTRPTIRSASESWRRANGSLTLLGRTGSGKTASAIAIAHRILDAAHAKVLPRDAMAFAAGLRFVSAVDLAQARKRHKLGNDEPPLERAAKRATLLILDEVGFESLDERTVTDVIEFRYRNGAHEHPTIITSGLSEAELAARYGDAIKRKLCELGRVVGAFEVAA